MGDFASVIWMDYPSIYLIALSTRRLAILSMLTALCLSIQLLPRPMNLEFTSLITFVTGMLFGSLYGGFLGALVMFVNAFFSPYGFAGVVMPFQMGGMGVIGIAGGVYARTTDGKFPARLGEAAVLGAFLTFVYDVLTNVGTAVFLMTSGLSFSQALGVALVSGVVPSIIHISWNTAIFFVATVPLVEAIRMIRGMEVTKSER